MGEFTDIIHKVKRDKNEFYLVVDKMKPLITKYINKLYKDDKEDSYSEFMMALWEGICNIEFYENDGQVVNYLSTAVRNKFFELYRKSKKTHEYEIVTDDDCYQNVSFQESKYNEIALKIDIEKFVSEYSGIKKEIYYLILVENMTDAAIAKRLQVSRQYINKVRKNLQVIVATYAECTYCRRERKE